MPPKGSKKVISSLGDVFSHDKAYRVRVKINGNNEYGPWRHAQAAAYRDLRQAQAAGTQEQYVEVLKQLKENPHPATVGGPHLAAVEQPSASSGGAQR